MNTEWNTEEVLAFIHDVRSWRDLDDRERVEWVRRVKHIRDNVTTDRKPWTNSRLAGLFGLEESGLEKRFSRSEAVSTPDGPAEETRKRAERSLRQAVRQDPSAIVAAVKDSPETFRALVSDPETRKAIHHAEQERHESKVSEWRMSLEDKPEKDANSGLGMLGIVHACDTLEKSADALLNSLGNRGHDKDVVEMVEMTVDGVINILSAAKSIVNGINWEEFTS